MSRLSPPRESWKRLYILSAAMAAAGVVVSAYLMDSEQVVSSGFCEVGSRITCVDVLLSPYASFMGIPTAGYGLAWFAIALTLSILSTRSEKMRKPLLAWSILGLLGIAALVYVELAIINALCLFCTAAHILGVGIFSTSYIAYVSWHESLEQDS